MSALTVSGAEVTDAVRAAAAEGDGLTGDSSFGVWPASTNLHPNGGFETSLYAWAAFGGAAAIARVNTDAMFGAWCCAVTDGIESAAFALLTELRDGAVSAWVKAATPGTLTVTLTSTSGAIASDATLPVTTAWTRVVLFYACPDWATTTESATLAIERNGGGDFLLDGVQVQQNPSTEIGTNLTDGVLTPYAHRDDDAVLWTGQANLHPNGDFETDTTGWVNHGAGASIAQSAGWAHTGTQSLAVTCDTTVSIGAKSLDFLTLAASTDYVLSFWLSGPATETYKVEVYDGATRIAVDFAWAPGKAEARKILPFTSLASPANCDIVVSKNSANAITFYVDALEVKQQPVSGEALVVPDGVRGYGDVALPAAGLVRADQMWFAVRLRPGFGTTEHPGGSPRIFRWREDDAHRLDSFYAISTEVWGVRRAYEGDHFFSCSVPASSVPCVRGQTYTFVGQYTPDWIAISIDGSSFDAYPGQSKKTGGAVPVIAAATAEIAGCGAAEGSPSGGKDVLWLALGYGTLTDAMLTAIHAFGDADPRPTDFPTGSRPIAVWAADDATYWRRKPRHHDPGAGRAI